MAKSYLNQIATAVPDFDVHAKFIDYCPRFLPDARARRLFQRMASRSQIEHRYSFLEPSSHADRLDVSGFYTEDAFPSTEARMASYEQQAFCLARRALDQLDLRDTTHLVITTCTGFYAPGLDKQIIAHYGLSPAVERTNVGFMGCQAALNALKLARHIVRSEPDAKVLTLNLELCTLHLKPSPDLEEMLSFLIFADGCAAALVSARPNGLALERFCSTVIPQAAELISWRIGAMGFDMHLSGQLPALIARELPGHLCEVLDGRTQRDLRHWAIHPGGRSVLDAVREGAGLEEHNMQPSREVLRRFGNMSSATIMFVLKDIMDGGQSGEGCALAFGPGVSVESMRFRVEQDSEHGSATPQQNERLWR